VTTSLTTKGANIGVEYTLRWTDYHTRLLGLDAGGLYSVELENRRGREVTVGSNPTPSANESLIIVSLPPESRNPRVCAV
jgi:hypothetical protein